MPKSDRTLLLAEDEDDQIAMWRRDLQEYNARTDAAVAFDIIEAKTHEAASAALRRNIIDCAIVDLRLPGIEGEQATAEQGNALMQEISEQVAMPVVLFSGHLAEADERWPKQVLRLTRENASVDKAIQWLADAEGLMEALAATRSQIGAETAHLFFSQIWAHWDETQRQGLAKEALHQVVARQVVSHIAAQLSFDGANLLAHHVNEFYFIPPLREARIHTGDLVRMAEQVYVILTPQCDIVREYPQDILVALCEPSVEWDEASKRLRATPDHNGSLRKLDRLGNQNVGIGAHFLPPCGPDGPWLVNFRKVKTVDSTTVPELLQNRIASIAPQFIPNLIQRFAAFIGRVGQPSMDVRSLARRAAG